MNCSNHSSSTTYWIPFFYFVVRKFRINEQFLFLVLENDVKTNFFLEDIFTVNNSIRNVFRTVRWYNETEYSYSTPFSLLCFLKQTWKNVTKTSIKITFPLKLSFSSFGWILRERKKEKLGGHFVRSLSVIWDYRFDSISMPMSTLATVLLLRPMICFSQRKKFVYKKCGITLKKSLQTTK